MPLQENTGPGGQKFSSPAGDKPGRWPDMNEQERDKVYSSLKEVFAGKYGGEARTELSRNIYDEVAGASKAYLTDPPFEATDPRLKGMPVSMVMLLAFQQEPGMTEERAKNLMFYSLDYLQSQGINIDLVDKGDKISVYYNKEAERWKLKAVKADGTERFDGFIFPERAPEPEVPETEPEPAPETEPEPAPETEPEPVPETEPPAPELPTTAERKKALEKAIPKGKTIRKGKSLKFEYIPDGEKDPIQCEFKIGALVIDGVSHPINTTMKKRLTISNEGSLALTTKEIEVISFKTTNAGLVPKAYKIKADWGPDFAGGLGVMRTGAIVKLEEQGIKVSGDDGTSVNLVLYPDKTNPPFDIPESGNISIDRLFAALEEPSGAVLASVAFNEPLGEDGKARAQGDYQMALA